jgi:hypothetical protein
MYDFTVKREGFFVIHQQQAKPVTDSHIGTRRQISYANSTETDIAGLAQPDRFLETFVFDRQSQPGINVVTRKSSTFTLG